MTWREMALENLDAAKLLMKAGMYRSSVSRSYYTAYTVLTGELASQGVEFRKAEDNPTHAQLGQLVRHNLDTKKYSENTRRRLRRILKNLWRSRVIADYDPRIFVGKKEARLGLTEVADVMRSLGEI